MDLGFRPAFARRDVIEVPGAVAFWRAPLLFPAATPVFLLDSALEGGRLGRWSYAGGEPLACLAGRSRRDGVDGEGLDLELTVWREPDGEAPAAARRLAWTGDPYAALRAVRRAYAPDNAAVPDASPLAGGLVGWFGYGAARATERLPRRLPAAGAPDLLFLVFDDVLRHEHATGRTTLVVAGRGSDEAAAAADLGARREAWQAMLPRWPEETCAARLPVDLPAAAAAEGDATDLADFTAACDEALYRAQVERCRSHILCGDAFEICLTQSLSAPWTGDPWVLYRALRELNPAPFAAFLRCGGLAIAGASPERFLSCTAGGRLESRPIKGTRPRGATPASDEALRRDLAEAEKDAAENTMIVDLVRSDLGRVARVGSVDVPELRIVETYATVHQLVSTITADLKPGCDALDAVRACFPGGSMTGAPKLEAMAIIESLEGAPRGVYSGALGWLGWDGAMDLSIVIRTFVCDGRHATFGTGGAVTADSDPAAEYRESLDKARALVAARRLATRLPEGSA